MPEAESPQLRSERFAGVVAVSLVCLALPSVALLVNGSAETPEQGRAAIVWLAGCAVVGVVLPLIYWSPNRALGFVGFGALAWLVVAMVSVLTGEWPGRWAGWANGLPLGLVVGAVVRGQRGEQLPEENTILVTSTVAGGFAAWLISAQGWPYEWAGYFVPLVAIVLVVATWTRLFRPLFELSLEPVVWVMYHIRGRGPGVAELPRTGPCLVLANHACWLDPLFIAKVVPRPITPMMTARFYDLPFLRRLMLLFGVIRVPEKAIKHKAPEIQEAIAALDRGECVVVFPEGYLRRTEESPLRRFGQGVWQILAARPNTPVITCWIEGGWGSYTSYFNGKPTKNKRPDFQHRITIGVNTPVTVPAEVLTEQLRTRFHLMNCVSAAREHIGLPVLSPFQMPSKDEVVVETVPEPGDDVS